MNEVDKGGKPCSMVVAGVLVTAADAFVLLLVEQWGVRQLEAVFGVFIAVMAGSFGIMYSNADIPQSEVLQGELQLRSQLKNCSYITALMDVLAV